MQSQTGGIFIIVCAQQCGNENAKTPLQYEYLSDVSVRLAIKIELMCVNINRGGAMCWDLFTQIVSLHLINFSKNILVCLI